MSSLMCSMCKDQNDDENPIKTCSKCELNVHVCCYGIQNTENFICSPCGNEAGDVTCALCEKPKGALKKTTDGRYVHVLCTLFTEAAQFIDKDLMEPIDISGVKPPKKRAPCVYCNENMGTFKCCKCSKALHAICGHENNSLVEKVLPNDDIKFLGYCNKHLPNTVKKRLSSEGLTAAVKLKKKKGSIARSNQENSKWILDKIDSQLKTTDGDVTTAEDEANCLSNDNSAANFSAIDLVETVRTDIPMKSALLVKLNATVDISGQSDSKSAATEANQNNKKQQNSTDNFITLEEKSSDGSSTPSTTDSLCKNSDEGNDTSEHECYKDAVIEKV